MRFYIIDNLGSLTRTGRRGEPQSCTLEHDNRHYADKFNTRSDAEKLLTYWKNNNNFKGRVITEQDGREMVEGF